jgi:hypothetical protein
MRKLKMNFENDESSVVPMRSPSETELTLANHVLQTVGRGGGLLGLTPFQVIGALEVAKQTLINVMFEDESEEEDDEEPEDA